MTNQASITKKLKHLIILSIEDFDPTYIKQIRYNKLTETYRVIVKDAFFIQTFNKYNNDDFELLELYWNKNAELSIYIKYNGAVSN